MLFLAPYDMPKNKIKTTAKGTRSVLRRKSTLVISSDDETDPSTTNDDDEEGGDSPPAGGGEKREASMSLEAEAPKQGKKTSPRGSAATGALTTSCPPTGQPSNEPYVIF